MTKRKITSTDKINILELSKLRENTPKYIALVTGISKTTVNSYRQKFRVNYETPPEIIDRIIRQIMIDEESEGINYDKQQSCLHPHIFVKCPHCKLVLSEKDAEKIHMILSKYEPQIEKILIQQEI